MAQDRVRKSAADWIGRTQLNQEAKTSQGRPGASKAGTAGTSILPKLRTLHIL
jgi:hypothetical protein